MSNDPRAILGVGPDATGAQIRAAYRRAAKLAHPDLGGSSEAFRRVQAAADALLAELEVGEAPTADWFQGDRRRAGLPGHWTTASAELSRRWGLPHEPAVVFAPQKIGLSPFVNGTSLNAPALDWLNRAIGRRGEHWDFHTADQVTRIFFRSGDDAKLFQLRFF